MSTNPLRSLSARTRRIISWCRSPRGSGYLEANRAVSWDVVAKIVRGGEAEGDEDGHGGQGPPYYPHPNPICPS
jgi:hypothetical protein